MKTCTKCGKRKRSSSFYARSAQCIACRKVYQEQYYRDHPEKLREKIEKTTARNEAARIREYEIELAAQGGRCAICGCLPEEGKRLSRDHCHRSGQRRGLLCNSCNYGLGCFKDNPAALQAAVEYLEKWSA